MSKVHSDMVLYFAKRTLSISNVSVVLEKYNFQILDILYIIIFIYFYVNSAHFAKQDKMKYTSKLT